MTIYVVQSGETIDTLAALRLAQGKQGEAESRYRQALELAQKARFSRHVLSQEELARLRALIDAERARLCQTLGPVKRSAFRWLWGAPAPAKYGENTERSQENTP